MARILEGKVAIVTGSGRGIGRGIALKLAEEGAKVVVNALTPEKLNETVELIRSEGNIAIGIRADVRSATEVEAMVEQAVAELGPVEILVNNAGVNRDAMFEKMTENQWDEVIDTHLKGSWLCIKYASPYMRQQGYGRVINIGSEGYIFGNMGMVNYVAAKAGMVGLTMTIARELGRWGRKDGSDMTCNLIMPGFNVTRMTDGVPDKIREQVLEQIVAGRVADAREDVGSVVAFLASKGAAYVTGSKIGVNGGLHMNVAS